LQIVATRISEFNGQSWPTSTTTFTQNHVQYTTQLWRALHVNIQPKPSESTADRLWVTQPFVDLLNGRFSDALSPGRDMCIDETMIKYRGDHPSIQMMPKKPIPIGFKLFSLSDLMGFTFKQLLYTGSTNSTADEDLSRRVVLLLIDSYLGDADSGPYRTVVMDSYYSGVPLFRDLWERGTLAIGSMHRKRAMFPKDLHERKDKTHVKLEP
jgi:hypothetical protein